MRYSLLLRGVNVGGNHKVPMADLRAYLSQIGLVDVTSYINSGNLFFSSDLALAQLRQLIWRCLKKYYPFITAFALISRDAYHRETENLPKWWWEDLARKDVLFYTDIRQKEEIETVISQLTLRDELVYFGETAIFWGKCQEASYLKTAYHKELAKQPFYRSLTIRNHKTFAKLNDFLT